jgi:hypothetical protein
MKRILLIILVCLGVISVKAQNQPDSLLRIYDRCWEVSPGIYRVMKNGNVGVVGEKGILVPIEYQQVWSLSDKNYFRVMRNGKTGLYHTEKGIVVPPDYDQIWNFSDGMMRVSQNGKLGIISASGDVIAPCQYQQIWDFNNDMAKVIRDGKLGYINRQGQETIPAIYQQIGSFDNGQAKVVRDGKTGYIDMQGNEVVPCDYQQIWDYQNGMAKVVKNGQIGFINTQGNEVIPPIFSQIWDFEGDSAKAVLDGSLVYIDRKGTVLSALYQTAPIVPPVEPVIEPDMVEEIEATDVENSDTIKTIHIGTSTIIIKENGNNTTINLNPDDDGDDHHHRHDKFKGHHFGVDLGLNNYMGPNGTMALPNGYEYLSLNTAKSIGVSVNVWQESISLSHGNNFGLVTGLGLDYNNYRFDNQYKLVKANDGTIGSEPIVEDVDKNKLMAFYITMPLMLEWQLRESDYKNPFYISAGVVGGLRAQSHIKIKYNSGDKEKTRGDYDLSDLRWGIRTRMGVRCFNMHATYYFTPLFEHNQNPELYPYNIGLSVMPNWF